MLKIISAVLINKQNKILLLKRTSQRKSYPNKWNVISGKIENETPLACAKREIIEELGQNVKIKLIKQGEIFIDKQKDGSWLVYPLLYRFIKGKIKLNDEHSEFKWVERQKIKTYDIVPGLLKDFKQLNL